MTAIAKSAKRHPAAKKCCGWEETAICIYPQLQISLKFDTEDPSLVLL